MAPRLRRWAVLALCWTASWTSSPAFARKLLLISPSVPANAADTQRARLFQSWGYDVSLLSENASELAMAAAADQADVAFVSEQCNDARISTKLRANPIGIVTDDYGLCDELGLAAGAESLVLSGNSLIDPAAHNITGDFADATPLPDLLGSGRILVARQPAAAAVALTRYDGRPHFLLLEKSSLLVGGGSAAGRRALIGQMLISRRNADVELILKRALDWAADRVDFFYFVAPDGDDRHDGKTAESAFRSVARAAATASAGDTVFIAPGSYRGDLRVVNGGRRNGRLEFRGESDTKHRSRLEGSDDASGAVVSVEGKYDVQFTNLDWTKGGNGVLFSNSTRCELRDCRIRKLKGVGVRCRRGQVTVRGCLISDSSLDGAVVESDAHLTMIDTQCVKNKGAGVRVSAATADIQSTLLEENRDGVRLEQDGAANLSGVELAENQFGFIGVGGRVDVTLTACELHHNKQHGAHLAGSLSKMLLDRCRLYRNKGDGCRVVGARGQLVNCLLYRNQGNGVSGVEAEILVSHVTSAYNDGNGISLDRSTGAVGNSLTAFNRQVGLLLERSRARCDYNLVHGNARGDYGGVQPGGNDRGGDPAFLNVAADDFQLTSGSPAVDTGVDQSVNVDVQEVRRPIGVGFDIGCFEEPHGRRLRILRWREVR